MATRFASQARSDHKGKRLPLIGRLSGLHILLPTAAFFLMPLPIQAEENSGSNPITSFRQQFIETKKALSDLGPKIGDSVKNIEGLTKPDAIVAEVDSLMNETAETLAELSDNGTLATAADSALKIAQQKIKKFETDTRMKYEEREPLLQEWKNVAQEMEEAINQFTAARRELVQLLGTLQSKYDVLIEWQTLENARGVVEALRQITNDIRNASNPVRNFLRSTGSPGS